MSILFNQLFFHIEKRLSINNSIITKERNQLSKAAINGLRAKDVVKFYDTELLKKFLFLVTAAILNGGQGCRTQF
jgi:hypothetical protein